MNKLAYDGAILVPIAIYSPLWTATIMKLLLFMCLISIIPEKAVSHCTDYRGGGEEGRGVILAG